jgi:hypothetical protein
VVKDEAVKLRFGFGGDPQGLKSPATVNKRFKDLCMRGVTSSARAEFMLVFDCFLNTQ